MIDRMLRAADWGLDCAKRGIAPQGGNLPYLFIHHVAGQTPDLTAVLWDDDPVTYVRNLDEYARRVKGYKALDYSWLIHRAATGIVTLIEGRGYFFPAATLDMNSVSKAIAFCGSFGPAPDPITTERPPTASELAACEEWVGQLLNIGTLAPHVQILGHRDNPAHPGATSCPGDWLYRALPTIDPRLQTPPTPPTEDDDMPLEVIELVRVPASGATYAVYGTARDRELRRGVHKAWIDTGGKEGVDAVAAAWGVSPIPRDLTSEGECHRLGPVFGRIPDGHDTHGWAG